MKLGYHCSQEVNNHKRCHETGCECLCHKTVTESEFLMATGNYHVGFLGDTRFNPNLTFFFLLRRVRLSPSCRIHD